MNPCIFDKTIDANSTLCSAQQAYYCASDSSTCFGICPNPDLAGIGVRAGFYLQTFMSAALVIFSPEDSTQGAWSATMLTAAEIIPALIQKAKGSLTLHHATLVMNFATLSTLASLAAAPRCSIWRSEASRKKYVKEGKVGRIILSVALLVQISLQWTWAIVLFTSGKYSQPACAPETYVLLFGIPILASAVDGPGGPSFAIWPFHLLFNLALTLTWGIILAFSSASAVHDTPIPTPARRHLQDDDPPIPRRDDESTLRYEGRKRWEQLKRWVMEKLPVERARRWIMFSNALAVLFVVMEITMTEVQTFRNKILTGENEWGFGQTAAVLLAIVPIWAIIVALNNRGLHPENTYDLTLPYFYTHSFPASAVSRGPPSARHSQHSHETHGVGRGISFRPGRHDSATQAEPTHGNSTSTSTNRPTVGGAKMKAAMRFRHGRSGSSAPLLTQSPPTPELRTQEEIEMDTLDPNSNSPVIVLYSPDGRTVPLPMMTPTLSSDGEDSYFHGVHGFGRDDEDTWINDDGWRDADGRDTRAGPSTPRTRSPATVQPPLPSPSTSTSAISLTPTAVTLPPRQPHLLDAESPPQVRARTLHQSSPSRPGIFLSSPPPADSRPLCTRRWSDSSWSEVSATDSISRPSTDTLVNSPPSSYLPLNRQNTRPRVGNVRGPRSTNPASHRRARSASATTPSPSLPMPDLGPQLSLEKIPLAGLGLLGGRL